MNLVFFDIECAGVHKTYAKICAFGYVMCDEKFNIIEKRDILINPKGRFELTDRRGDKGIVLPYNYDEFKNYPKFSAVYPEIKALLENKDNVVIGHAVLNDVKYLNLETKRFRLPSFKFSFADSQMFFMASINDFSRQFGLEFIAQELGVEFTPHRAADDAYATMKVVEAMCKKHDCDFFGLTAILGFTAGKISNYNVTPPQCSSYRKYKQLKNKEKFERAQKRIEFNNNVTRRRQKVKGRLTGKKFNFSRKIEDNTAISLDLVDKIYELGGFYCQRVEECTHYVTIQDDDSDRTKKAEAAGKIILTLEQFGELLND
jgi:DNA polymerase III epsilon subunit-like protein